MHYLIDGHNLIARMPDIEIDDPDDEAKLVLHLKSWAAGSRKRRITVYFDGGLPGGKSADLSSGPVQVTFASPGREADHLLIRRIRSVNNPPEYTLVTSDRKIIATAQKRRMPFITAEDFVREMLEDAMKRRQPAPPPPETDDPQLSDKEVAEWLEIFGPEPETPRKRRRKGTRSERRKGKKRRKKRPSRPADKLKDSGAALTKDEIDEWLDLFSDSSE